MLEIIIGILIVAWLLGLVAFHVGGLIHILLVIALVVLVYRLVRGDRVV